MIDITFGDSDRTLVARIRAKMPMIMRAVIGAMDLQMFKLQLHVVRDKLSGEVLNRGPNRPGHSGGTLAASIRKAETIVLGSRVVGQTLGAGGDAWYGRVHEYGGVFHVAHRQVTQVFGRPVKGDVFTRSYDVTFPQRSFMRSSLEDLRDEIAAGLREAVQKELKS